MNTSRQSSGRDPARSATLLVCAIAAAAGVARAGWEPFNPYRSMYAVGEDNRMYVSDREDVSFRFDRIAGFEALPTGERAVGMDFVDFFSHPIDVPGGWYILSDTGKVFTYEFDQPAGMWRVVQRGGTAPVPFAGDGYGFDIDGRSAYVSIPSGRSLRFDLQTNSWSVRAAPVHANGMPTNIAGLAVFDQRGTKRFVGLDITDSTVAHYDADAPGAFTHVVVEGPAQYASIPNPEPLPFAGAAVAGFDAVLYANLLNPFPTTPEGWFGGVALNHPTSPNTVLYPFVKFWPYQEDGLFFQQPVDLIARSDPALRFTAIAFSPTPGSVAVFAAGLIAASWRRRYFG